MRPLKLILLAFSAQIIILATTSTLLIASPHAWNTFFGHGPYLNGFDNGEGVAVDDDGNVYVVGSSGRSWGDPVNPFNYLRSAFWLPNANSINVFAALRISPR